MKSTANKKKASDKSKSAAVPTNPNGLAPRWKKWDIISKIILGLLGIAVTFFIQYQQWILAKRMDRTNREFEKSRIMISRGQLASTLIENVIKGSEKEKKLALAILESTTSDMYPRIVEALAVEAPDEPTRKHAIELLGKKGDVKSARVLSQIMASNVPPQERTIAMDAWQRIKLRMLKNARAFYEAGLYQSAAEEFKNVVALLSDSEADSTELELAGIAMKMQDYEQAASHYMKATEKISTKLLYE